MITETECCLKYSSIDENVSDKTAAVIVCGGRSSRMNGVDKMFAQIGGMPVFARSVAAFERCDAVDRIVIVAAKESILKMQQICFKYGFGKVTDIVEGGACREESVKNGIAVLRDVGTVLIHDGARPLVTETIIRRVADAAAKYYAAACAVKLKDTVKKIGADGLVTGTPDRSSMVSVQTPQGFSLELIKNAMDSAGDLSGFTDDCSVVEKYGAAVYTVDGDYRNIKITTADDLGYAEYLLGEKNGMNIRTGHGYDVHRFEMGRKLILGGVDIPYEKGLLGHSDADVLLHAVCDALLGAAGLGDIGKHFPDTDDRFLGADSRMLLRETVRLIKEKGFSVSNIDATVILQKPKIAEFVPQMAKNIADDCLIDAERVNVKATTEEKLGFTGSGDGAAAHAVCLIVSE